MLFLYSSWHNGENQKILPPYRLEKSENFSKNPLCGAVPVKKEWVLRRRGGPTNTFKKNFKPKSQKSGEKIFGPLNPFQFASPVKLFWAPQSFFLFKAGCGETGFFLRGNAIF